MAKLSTFVGFPVSIPLSAVSLAGASISGVAMALTKKYQKKLSKVKKLIDIVTLALAVFEMSVSKAFNDCKIDEQESNMLQTSHSEVLNDVTNAGSQMAAETRSQFKKSSTGRNQRPKERIKNKRSRDHSLDTVWGLRTVKMKG